MAQLQQLQERATLRGQGTVWSQDPKTGQLTATNTPETRSLVGSSAGMLQPSMQGSVPSAPAYAPPDFEASMREINSIDNVEGKMAALLKFSGSMDAMQSGFKQEAVQKAQQEYGIAGLEQQLAQAEQIDRSSPNHVSNGGRFAGDSPLTAPIRQQLESARARSMVMAEEYFKNDARATELGGKARLFIGMQAELLQNAIKNGISGAELLKSTSDNTTSAISKIFPETRNKSPMEALDYAKVNATPEQKAVIQYYGDSRKMLELVTDGNASARDVIIERQAESVGGEVGSADYNQVKSNTDMALRELEKNSRPSNLQDTLTTLYTNSSNTAIANNAAALAQAEAKKVEADKAEAARMAKEAATELFQVQRGKQLQGNVNLWPRSAKNLLASSVTLTSIVENINRIKGMSSINTPTSIQEIASSIIDMPFSTPQEMYARKQAEGELLEAAKEAARAGGKGVLGGIPGGELGMQGIVQQSIANAIVSKKGFFK